MATASSILVLPLHVTEEVSTKSTKSFPSLPEPLSFRFSLSSQPRTHPASDQLDLSGLSGADESLADLQPEQEEEGEGRGGWENLVEEQKVPLLSPSSSQTLSLSLPLSLSLSLSPSPSEAGVHGVPGTGTSGNSGGDPQTTGHVQVGVREMVGQIALHCELRGWEDRGLSLSPSLSLSLSLSLSRRTSVWCQSLRAVSTLSTYSTVSRGVT